MITNNLKTGSTSTVKRKQHLLVVAHVESMGRKKSKGMTFTFLEKKFKNEEIKHIMFPSIKMKKDSDLEELFFQISIRKSTVQIEQPDYIDTFDYEDDRGKYTVLLYCIEENEQVKLHDSPEDEQRHVTMYQIEKYPEAVTPLSKECAQKTFDFLWDKKEKEKNKPAAVGAAA